MQESWWFWKAQSNRKLAYKFSTQGTVNGGGFLGGGSEYFAYVVKGGLVRNLFLPTKRGGEESENPAYVVYGWSLTRKLSQNYDLNPLPLWPGILWFCVYNSRVYISQKLCVYFCKVDKKSLPQCLCTLLYWHLKNLLDKHGAPMLISIQGCNENLIKYNFETWYDILEIFFCIIIYK